MLPVIGITGRPNLNASAGGDIGGYLVHHTYFDSVASVGGLPVMLIPVPDEHVDDVLDAYVRLLDASVPADVYNVASEQAVPIQAILNRLIEIAEIDPIVETDPERWRPTDWSVGDASRLRAATNWKPRIPLDALLRELYEDWLERDSAP